MAASDNEFVLRVPVVQQCIDVLLSRDTHQFFPAYLHLRRRASATGSTEALSPDWAEVHTWLNVPGGPYGKPNLRPFWHGKRLAGQEWMGKNLAGSYSPSSLRQAPKEVVEIDAEGRYALRPQHWELARKFLLSDETLPVLALAGFLFRNFAIVSDEPLSPQSLVALFRGYFGYATPDDDPEFNYLYDVENPLELDDWFQPRNGYQASLEGGDE
jgi:hypothetical protein